MRTRLDPPLRPALAPVEFRHQPQPFTGRRGQLSCQRADPGLQSLEWYWRGRGWSRLAHGSTLGTLWSAGTLGTDQDGAVAAHCRQFPRGLLRHVLRCCPHRCLRCWPHRCLRCCLHRCLHRCPYPRYSNSCSRLDDGYDTEQEQPLNRPNGRYVRVAAFAEA